MDKEGFDVVKEGLASFDKEDEVLLLVPNKGTCWLLLPNKGWLLPVPNKGDFFSPNRLDCWLLLLLPNRPEGWFILVFPPPNKPLDGLLLLELPKRLDCWLLLLVTPPNILEGLLLLLLVPPNRPPDGWLLLLFPKRTDGWFKPPLDELGLSWVTPNIEFPLLLTIELPMIGFSSFFDISFFSIFVFFPFTETISVILLWKSYSLLSPSWYIPFIILLNTSIYPSSILYASLSLDTITHVLIPFSFEISLTVISPLIPKLIFSTKKLLIPSLPSITPLKSIVVGFDGRISSDTTMTSITFSVDTLNIVSGLLSNTIICLYFVSLIHSFVLLIKSDWMNNIFFDTFWLRLSKLALITILTFSSLTFSLTLHSVNSFSIYTPSKVLLKLLSPINWLSVIFWYLVNCAVK